MSAFDDLNARAALFGEDNMGESFSYTSLAGVTTSGLTGVFNQVSVTYTLDDFSQRKDTQLTLASSKPQWGSVVPANRATITYGGVSYAIESIAGASTAGDPWYTLTLKLLT